MTQPGQQVITQRRWLMAAVLGLLNLSNNLLWISFSAISDITAVFYETTSLGVLALSAIFIVVMFSFGIPTIWIIQRIRLRGAMHLAALFNFVSSMMRIVSALDFIPHNYRFYVVLLGQIIGSFGQPFSNFSTTELANIWFPQSERVIANAITSMCGPLGLLVANLVAPLLVHSHYVDKELQNAMLYLNICVSIPSVKAALLCVVIVRHSHPVNLTVTAPYDTAEQDNNTVEDFIISSQSTATVINRDNAIGSIPPSALPSAQEEAAQQQNVSLRVFLQQLRQIMSLPFVILVFSFATGTAVFTTISSEIGNMFCSRGYSDKFAGLCGALLIAVGIPGSLVVGLIVDKTKRFLEAIKICFALAVLGAISFAVAVCYYDMQAWILISLCWFSFFGLAVYATSLELGVECTYPAPEVQSSGLLIMFSQLFSLVILFIVEGLATPLTGAAKSKASCASGDNGQVDPKDYFLSMMLMVGITVAVAIGCILFLNTPYRRLQAEKGIAANSLVGQANN